MITLDPAALDAARKVARERGDVTMGRCDAIVTAYVAILAAQQPTAGLCLRCAGTGRDPGTTSLQCCKCMGQGAVVLR